MNYIGLSLSSYYQYSLSSRWQFYAKASAAVHLPLRSTLSGYYLLPDGTKAEQTTELLHPGVQWSVGLGLGVQYSVMPGVSFFFEPSLQHFFHNGSGISTWNTEHKIVSSLPVGVKFTF